MDLEEKRARAKEYYRRNREKILEKARKRWSTHTAIRRSKSRLYKRKRRQAISDIERKSNLRRYGLTVERYNEILSKQGGVCAICQELPTGGERLCVDHSHTTKKVRGLLCRHCNTGIGMLKDSHTIIKNSLRYLENPPAEAR